MKVIGPFYKIETDLDGERILRNIERAGRTCYKTEIKPSDIDIELTKAFVRKIIERGHESVIEHESITVRFICDRGVTHELVRHRLCAFSQESTRYCNYGNERFGKEITVIKPLFFDRESFAYAVWRDACKKAEEAYFDLLDNGASPQQARAVLPNSLKTEIVTSANLREWRHILRLRTSKAAHPQIREIMIPLLKELQAKIPVIFDDI